uniref:Uncharacterized protein n=1 Tax=Rhizophora mucronata TaxID=61149 RepID=A0A2P2IVN5_RHIMU
MSMKSTHSSFTADSRRPPPGVEAVEVGGSNFNNCLRSQPKN